MCVVGLCSWLWSFLRLWYIDTKQSRVRWVITGLLLLLMIVLVTEQHESGSSGLTTQEVSTCKGVPTTHPLTVKLTFQ